MFDLTLGQFVVALFMSLGALCVFIWAVLAGLFDDIEGIKYEFYQREVMTRDENRKRS